MRGPRYGRVGKWMHARFLALRSRGVLVDPIALARLGAILAATLGMFCLTRVLKIQ
jgi:hypothetical protein